MRLALSICVAALFLFACAGLPPMVPLDNSSPVAGAWEGELKTVKGDAMLRVEIDGNSAYRWEAAGKNGNGTLTYGPEGEMMLTAYNEECVAKYFADETRRFIRVTRIGGGAFAKLLPVE